MRWRTGNKNARNLYIVTQSGDEFHVGVTFTEALGRYIADALNERSADSPPMSDHEALSLSVRPASGEGDDRCGPMIS